MMEIDRNVVRQARQARGWTQQQLAEIANLSMRTIQRVENQGVGSHETVAALCAVLEVERTQILDQQSNGPADKLLRTVIVIPAAIFLGMAIGSALTMALIQ